jgi:hypothetical protein
MLVLAKMNGKSEKLVEIKMHGVFAYFTVTRAVYEAAIKNWQHKMKIKHQILASETFRYSGRRVLVRVFPNGKVSFIIRASERPADLLVVHRIYNRICRDLKAVYPELKPRFGEFDITRADVHVDSVALPKLYPIVPVPGTVISVHKVKSVVGKVSFNAFRVEVRGPYDDAIRTLVKLLGLRRCAL